MKRRRLLFILLGCICSIILAVLLWPREREPEYNGVPLTKWLDLGAGIYAGHSDEFDKAVKALGTNALPTLVRSVDYQIPRWKLWLYCKVVSRTRPFLLNNPPVKWLLDDKMARRGQAAAIAFGILGTRASPALDDLRRIASKRPMGYASYALSNITSSIPADFNEPPENLN